MKLFVFLFLLTLSLQSLATVPQPVDLGPSNFSFVTKFSDDGQRLFTLNENQAYIWDADGKEKLKFDTRITRPISGDIGFASCKFIAYPTSDGQSFTSVKLLDEKTGSVLHSYKVLDGPYGEVRKIQFSKDCSKIFVSGEDPLKAGTLFVKIFNVTEETVFFLKEFTGELYYQNESMSGDASRIMLNFFSSLTVVDIKSGSELFKFSSLGNLMWAEFTPDSQSIVSIYNYSEFRIYRHDLAASTTEFVGLIDDPAINWRFQFDPRNDRSIVISGKFGSRSLYFLNIDSKAMSEMKFNLLREIDSYCIDKTNNRVLVLPNQLPPMLYDLATGNKVEDLPNSFNRNFMNCHFQPGGKKVAVASDSGALLYTLEGN